MTNEIDFQEIFLNSLLQKISHEQNALLCEPLSKSEIEYIYALNTMKKGKTPGPDGLSAEFFIRFWQIIGDDFTEVANEILSVENSCKSFKKVILPWSIKKKILLIY